MTKTWSTGRRALYAAKDADARSAATAVLELPGRLRESLARQDIGALYQAMWQAGVPQRIIAELTGQTQEQVSAIIRGRQVTALAELVGICDSLGLDREALGLPRADTASDRRPVLVPAVLVQREIVYRDRTESVGQEWGSDQLHWLQMAFRLGQRNFAALVGVSPGALSRWLNGIGPIPPARQARLDALFQAAPPEVQDRFAEFARHRPDDTRARGWVAHVQLGDELELDAAEQLTGALIAQTPRPRPATLTHSGRPRLHLVVPVPP